MGNFVKYLTTHATLAKANDAKNCGNIAENLG